MYYRERVENYIGRELFSPLLLMQKYPEYKLYEDINEVVHHINGDQSDNELRNLYVFRNNGNHIIYHRKVAKWGIGLAGKTQKEQLEYLKTFPILISNLDELRDLNERGQSLSYYMDD